jgi:hypothetical protein
MQRGASGAPFLIQMAPVAPLFQSKRRQWRPFFNPNGASGAPFSIQMAPVAPWLSNRARYRFNKLTMAGHALSNNFGCADSLG